MKIAQLLSGVGIILTNEEKKFVSKHRDTIALCNLDEHSLWMAQNLVRKGVYAISKDSQTLIKNINETNT
jgi:hypothetical protein